MNDRVRERAVGIVDAGNRRTESQNRAPNVCLSFGTWGQPPPTEDDPEQAGFSRLSNPPSKPPKAAVTLQESGGDVRNPDVPAIPGPGTPELGNPDSPTDVPFDLPVPSQVPVFDLTQEDDSLHETLPTPAPHISVTASLAGGPDFRNQLHCSPPHPARPLTS